MDLGSDSLTSCGPWVSYLDLGQFYLGIITHRLKTYED